MDSKNCNQCQKTFFKEKGDTNFKRKKFCSRYCFYQSRFGTNKVKLTCVTCKNVFEEWPYRATAKTCSKKCALIYQTSSKYRSLLREKNLGKKIPLGVRQKISLTQKGKRTGTKNHLWKGDKVGYRSMHEWVIRHRGTPDKCEHCGIIGSEAKKRLVWANKSHEYKRELDDWMRLCYRCHRKYDFPNEKHRT